MLVILLVSYRNAKCIKELILIQFIFYLKPNERRKLIPTMACSLIQF